MSSSTSASPATTANTSPEPPPAKTDAPPVQLVHYGGLIESIAADEGLHPQDVAIGMTAVLAGIAGPHAGLKHPSGHVIRPSLNLLYSGSLLARYKAFADRLFAPVRQHARTLRQDARLASLPLSDLTAFGGDLDNIGKAPPWVPWLKSDVAKHVQSQQWIQHAGMPPPGNVGGVPAPFPGPKHLPSLFFERLPLENIPAALAESVHREMLLLNPDNGLFDGRLSPRRAKDVHVQQLIALLGGVDMQFTKLHRNQGHGSFEHARVHLWARLPLKELGRILHDGSSPWHELPKRCLLWELLPKCDDLPEMYSPDESWQFYDRLVHKLIQERCFPTEHTDTVIRVPSPFLQHFQSWEHCFRWDLHIGEQNLSCDVAQHRDFFATMLWALSLFQQNGESYWCIEAAFWGAIRSIKRHLSICDQARSAYDRELKGKLEVKLTGILQKHGPSTLREVQRATDKLKAADLRPVFEHLTQQGRVSQDAQKRYVLIKPQASATSPAG